MCHFYNKKRDYGIIEPMPNGVRGFTMIELMVSMALMTMLIGLGMRNWGSHRDRAGSEGMVLVVASEVEAARAKALSSHLPVAFCLPSQNGSRPHTQSFYLMEGEVEPRATTTRLFTGDFPDSYIAAVFWGEATLNRPTRAGSFPADAVSTWLGSTVGQDFALVFMPDGSVMSNDLPLMDGEYRLLVASGLVTTPDSPGGNPLMPIPGRPQNFLLTQAYAAHTIAISPQGEVRVTPGVKNPAGVSIETGMIGTDSEPATSTPPAPPAASTPTIQSVAVYPKPFLNPKATVQQERNLSLTVEARDVDGQPLYCTWQSEPLGVGEKGFFSLEAGHPMTWDKAKRSWVSQCTWAPPPAAQVGAQYVLTCLVTDADGNVVNNKADILNPVTVIPPGKILFERGQTLTSDRDVFVVNSDGTGMRNLTDGPRGDDTPSISPDGAKVVWVNRNEGSKGEVYAMNTDGTGKVRITTNNESEGSPCWSPDGTRIFYSRGGAYYSANANGSGEAYFPTIMGSSNTGLSFSPDGRYVAHSALMGPGEIIVGEYANIPLGPPTVRDATNVTNNNTPSRIYDNAPTFVPGNSNYHMVWSSTAPGPSGNYGDGLKQLNVARLQDNGVGTVPRFELVDQQVIRTDGLFGLVFSPDASKVLFHRGTPNYGIFIGDWTDNGAAPPSISNERRLTGLSLAEYPRAWTRN